MNPEDQFLSKYVPALVEVAKSIDNVDDAPDAELRRIQTALLGQHALTPPHYVIPTWDISTGVRQYAVALRNVRQAGDKTQDALAVDLKTKQPNIARLERSGDDVNTQLITLEQWAGACSYSFKGLFLRMDDDPTSVLATLGIECAVCKYQFGDAADDALHTYLARLQFHSGADILTCYLLNEGRASTLDPLRNELVLFECLGVKHADKMGGPVKSRNVPFLMLWDSPRLIEEAATESGLKNSDFRCREKVSWLVSIPFSTVCAKGIIFLNFTDPSKKPTELHRLLALEVPAQVSFILSGVNRISIGSLAAMALSLEDSRRLAVMVREITFHGLTPNSARLLLELASELCNMRELYWTWHEVDLAREQIVLQCAYYQKEQRVFREPRTLSLRNSRGVVAEAARSGTYVLIRDLDKRRVNGQYEQLPDIGTQVMRSELAVPLNGPDGQIVGVLNVESPQLQTFSVHHAVLLEEIGQAVTIANKTHALIQNSRGTLKGSITRLFDALIDRGKTRRSDLLEHVANAALQLFGAAAVDIWEYDHHSGEFLIGGQAASPQFLRACESEDLVVNLNVWKPRPHGNSYRLMKNADAPQVLIFDSRDPSVSPATVERGIKSLAGFKICGPESVLAEGIFWVRFDHQTDLTEHIHACRTFASFIHMLWNPCQYHLADSEWHESVGA